MYEVSNESLLNTEISDANCMEIEWRLAEVSKDHKLSIWHIETSVASHLKISNDAWHEDCKWTTRNVCMGLNYTHFACFCHEEV